MTADCTITFAFQDGSEALSIGIIKETGHAFIVGTPEQERL
jgi:hypothetical protein